MSSSIKNSLRKRIKALKGPNKSLVFLFIWCLFLISCAESQKQESDPFQHAEWIDLTHDFEKETHHWPNVDRFKLDTIFAGMTDDGYYYETFAFSGAEHAGTHIDAPIHFAEGKRSVHELEIEELTGVAIVIDVRDSVSNNRDYQISVDDLENWEEQNGKIPKDAIVLFQTGHDQYWADKEKYMGTAETGEAATQDLHFPGLAPEAAEWLVEHRAVKATGIDTPSIDYGPSTDFKTHRILLGESIIGFENLKDLDKLAVKGDYIIALPMKIKGGSGGPLRIVALKK